MDRLTILRLALEKAKDPREALALAREMADFVEGVPPPPVVAPAPPPPTPKVTAKTNACAASKQEKPPRRKMVWTEDEKVRAAALLDAGASYAETGRVIGRSAMAVSKMRADGFLPVTKHQVPEINRLRGQLSALARGNKLKVKPAASDENDGA